METKELQPIGPKELTPAQKLVSGFNGMMNKHMAQIARAAPKNFDPDRLCRVVLSLYRSSPDLMKCTPASLLGGVMMCAQMGLEPGPLGEAYFVPFNNNKKLGADKKPVKEAQFILGYKGMMKLARRSGEISSIYGHGVYANDKFSFTYGMHEDLVHVPWHSLERPADEPGPMRGAYVIVKFKSGDVLPWFLPIAEIERHRDRSKAKDSPFWRDNYEKMAIKTVVRDMQAWLPMTVEDQRTIQSFDGAVKTRIEDDMTDVPNENDDTEDATIIPEEPPLSAKEKLDAKKPKAPANDPVNLSPAQATIAKLGNLGVRAMTRYSDKSLPMLTDEDCTKVMDLAAAIEAEDKDEKERGF